MSSRVLDHRIEGFSDETELERMREFKQAREESRGRIV